MMAKKRWKLTNEQHLRLEAWQAFLSGLDEKNQLDWSEAFADGQGIALGNHLDFALRWFYRGGNRRGSITISQQSKHDGGVADAVLA